MTDPNSRFQVVDNPNSRPGVCAICGSSGDGKRKFVDWGMQLDVFGAVYFCTECIGDLAKNLGYIPGLEYSKAHAEMSKLLTENESLRIAFEEYKNAARHILRNCNCDNGGNFGPCDNPPTETDSSTEAGNSDSDGESSESGVGEGLSDVRSDGDDESPKPRKRRTSST